MDGFAVDSGKWAVANGVLQVAAESKRMDAASVFYVDQALPSYYEVLASVKVTKPTAGWKANAYIIFDYYGPKDFKFAGVDVALNRFVLGHRDAQGWVVDAWAANVHVKPEIFYNVLLANVFDIAGSFLSEFKLTPKHFGQLKLSMQPVKNLYIQVSSIWESAWLRVYHPDKGYIR